MNQPHHPDPSEFGEPSFGFRWRVFDLEPGESANCRITFPRTIFSGTETVDHHVFALSDFWERGSFSYTLLPVHSEAPVELEASVERSPHRVGEPLIIDLQARNISGEPLFPFVIDSQQSFQLPGYEAFSADGCEAHLFATADPPTALVVRWYAPALEPNEAANCRLTFPDTPTLGTETISFLAWVQGTAWEDLTELRYTILPSLSAIPVPLGGPVWAVFSALLLLLAALWQLRWRRAQKTIGRHRACRREALQP